MHKLTIITTITILLLTFLLLALPLYLIQTNLTGQVILEEESYTYTKAICNESNYCQDHEITCKGKELVSVKPITGATIQFEENWEDPRDKKTIENMCD